MKNIIKSKNKSILLKFTVLFVLAIMIMFVFSPSVRPSAKAMYKSGYADGYAETYNTLCKKKAVNIEGDWDDKNYQEGYMAGQMSGAAKCDAEKKAMLTK